MKLHCVGTRGDFCAMILLLFSSTFFSFHQCYVVPISSIGMSSVNLLNILFRTGRIMVYLNITFMFMFMSHIGSGGLDLFCVETRTIFFYYCRLLLGGRAAVYWTKRCQKATCGSEERFVSPPWTKSVHCCWWYFCIKGIRKRSRDRSKNR